MRNEKLEAALRYAAAGLAVFPCVSGEKRPLVEHGLYEATTDPDCLRWWWSRWPEANLAMPTGRPGYDVVDVDVHPNGDGYGPLKRLREEGMLHGWTHAVRTPSHGLHVYFPGSDQRNSKITTTHIDFRGSGGYVLIPPSTIVQANGTVGRYETVAVNPNPPRPVDWAAIRNLLAPPQPQPVVPPGEGPDELRAPPERVVAWLARYVAHIPEGNRNDALFWAACRAAERGVTDPSPLRDAACQAGLSEREATKTIMSAYQTSGRTGSHRLARPREPRTPSSSPAGRGPGL